MKIEDADRKRQYADFTLYRNLNISLLIIHDDTFTEVYIQDIDQRVSMLTCGVSMLTARGSAYVQIYNSASTKNKKLKTKN